MRKTRSRMTPRFPADESMEGGAKLGMGKTKSSALAVLTKASTWWWQ